MMNSYTFKTDSESGTIMARTLQDAMDIVRPSAAAIADGAWAWVENEDGERLTIGKENMA
jgi:hypothetical protein